VLQPATNPMAKAMTTMARFFDAIEPPFCFIFRRKVCSCFDKAQPERQ